MSDTDKFVEVRERPQTVWERHAQTILAMILVALLLWVGSTVQGTALAVAEMRIEISYLKSAVDQPHERIDVLEDRLELLESHLLNHANQAHGRHVDE